MSSTYYFVLALGPATGVQMAATQLLTNFNVNFILIVVLLFVFAAKVMNIKKVTEMVFKFANILIGKGRKGMGHVNIIAFFIFSGMTGSAITNACVCIGSIFQPSISLILYGVIAQQSIIKLFAGGIIPGLIMGILLMVII